MSQQSNDMRDVAPRKIAYVFTSETSLGTKDREPKDRSDWGDMLVCELSILDDARYW